MVKGILPLTHTDELYYWLTTYQNGFVRRGLFGTLIAPLISIIDASRVHLIALESCLLALFAVLSLSAIVVRRIAAQTRGPAPWMIAGLFAASPLIGLVAHHVGYPDGIIAAAVLACGLALPCAPAWAIAAMLVLCSMLHELALLLFLPIVAFDRVIDPRGKLGDELLIGAAAVLGLCLPLLGGQGPSSLMTALTAAGLSINEAKLQVETSLHQGIRQAIEKMVSTWRHYPVNGCLGILYSGLPGLMLMIIGWPVKARVTTLSPKQWLRLLQTLAYVAACLSPVALLAIAWDLARLVSFTALTSLVAVNLVCRRSTCKISNSPIVIAASLSVAFAFMLMPVFNLYFDYARPLRLAMVGRLCPPCADIAIPMANFFNRDLSYPERTMLVSDPFYGNRR